MPANGGLDCETFLGRLAADECLINFGGFAIGKLGGQSVMGRIILRHHQTSAGILVQSMHNTRPCHAADAAELAGAMMEQGVHQCPTCVTGGRMHHDPHGFVDHQQTIIFIQNVQGDILRLRLG